MIVANDVYDFISTYIVKKIIRFMAITTDLVSSFNNITSKQSMA